MAGTDPIHQFVIYDLFPIHIGDEAAGTALNFSFTNSALFMVVAVVLLTGFVTLSASRGALVPSRFQLAGELMYTFVANMLRSSAGKEGMRFFPFVFSLFGFVLVANLLGMLVISVVILYGFFRHGFKFLKLFVPAGVPAYVLPIVVPIEIISFLSRPISLSVRLFGNILAGHITLKVFSGFVVSLGALGALGWMGAVLPLIMTVAISALELLVAVVQAYVFAVLTSMYLNDAVHPSH
jgi:F-type H+-transporting ATPase subunit a